MAFHGGNISTGPLPFTYKQSAKAEAIRVGPTDDPANYMGPVISAGARKSILEYIEVSKKEGRRLAAESMVRMIGLEPT